MKIFTNKQIPENGCHRWIQHRRGRQCINKSYLLVAYITAFVTSCQLCFCHYPILWKQMSNAPPKFNHSGDKRIVQDSVVAPYLAVDYFHPFQANSFILI